jgi:threonine dehydratase
VSTLFLLILGCMEFNKLKHVPSVTEIKQVAEQLKGVISETPLEYSASLSARYGAKIYLLR